MADVVEAAGATLSWMCFLTINGEPEQLFGVRWALVRKGIYLTAQPPLWGTGPSGLAAADVPAEVQAQLPSDVADENAHNTYLQIGSELGLATAFLWILLMGLAIARGIQSCPVDRLRNGPCLRA